MDERRRRSTPPGHHWLRGKKVEIAIGAPLSGMSGRLGTEMRHAAELAVEEKNAAGGVSGARVTALARDDKGDAKLGDAVAHGLAVRSHLLGVVGHLNSDVTIAASTVYHEAGLAMITPIASNPVVTDRKLANVFRLTNRDDHTGRAIASYLHHRLRKSRVAIFENDTAYGESMTRAFVTAFTQIGTIVSRTTVKVGTRDFDALVRALPDDIDVVFYGGMFEGAHLLKALRASGRMQRFAASDGCWDTKGFIVPAGRAAMQGEGVLVLAGAPLPGIVPGAKEFAARYTHRYGPIMNYAVNAYDATRILLTAIEQAAAAKEGMPTRDDVVSAIRGMTFQGIAYREPVQWDPLGDNRAAITALNIVDDGHFVQIAEIGVGPGHDYSWRSATIGSTRDARRAGR